MMKINKLITLFVFVLVLVICGNSLKVSGAMNDETYEYNSLTHSEIYGEWDNAYEEFNCYAFAIDRYEETKFYHNIDKKYYVGCFNPNMTTGQIDEESIFDSSVHDLVDLRSLVITDLTNLGYTDISWGTTQFSDLSPDERMICFRLSPEGDYHFMKYNNEENSWLHKPEFTQVLRYLGNPATDIWCNENLKKIGVDEDEYIYEYWRPSIFYTGTTIFVKYKVCTASISFFDTELNVNIDKFHDKMYELEIKYPGQYSFSCISENFPNAILLDEKMTTDSFVLYPGYCDYETRQEFSAILDPGKYYLQVKFDSDEMNGEINININTESCEYPSLASTNNDVLNNSQINSQGINECVFTFTANSSNFYKFVIFGSKIDSQLLDPSDFDMSIYDANKQLINKYSYDNYFNLAIKPVNSNDLIAYIETGLYYIVISFSSNQYNDIKLDIRNFDLRAISLFDSLSAIDSEISIWDSNAEYGDYLQTINIMESGKFDIEVKYNGSLNTQILFIIAKVDEDNIDDLILEYIYIDHLNKLNNKLKFNLDFDQGNYYIGYFNKIDNASMSLSIKRIINISNVYELIPDPSFNDLCGSQINIAERDVAILSKTYGQNTILQGFSRVIYLSNGNSRHNYNWYSSNESIAIVTEYGTVLGISPGRVNIIAVDKINYDVIFIKEFIVSADTSTTTKTIRLSDEIDYSDTPYLLKLNAQNCPFPKFSYYNWSISVISEENSSFYGTINQWGYVNVSKECEVCIVGRYKFNDNYTVLYFLTVN